MKTSPKLLPWLARKAGLSLEKAEALWRDAFADESNAFPCATDPDQFYRRVVECFRQHAGQEPMRASVPSRAATASSSTSARAGDELGPGFALA